MPEEELEELTQLYRDKGLSETTARQVAAELTAHDALAAHLEAELRLDPDDVASPWHAALASGIAFTTGAILPMLTILVPAPARVPVTFAAVLVALAITGWVAAWIGDSSRGRAVFRVVIGGALALAATFLIGRLLGVTGVV